MSATNKLIKNGHGLLNRTINALPFELHIPGYQFCGPGTHLEKRLARGDQGINPLDAACREHDIAYSRSNDLTERHAADRILGVKSRKRIIVKDSTLGEKVAATAVWAAMKAKTKIGMGMKSKTKTKTKMKTKKKTTKKRVLPTAKRGGILPVLPILGALGSLIGGTDWRGEDCERQQSCATSTRVAIARWKVEDFISLSANMDRDCTLVRTSVDRV